MSLETNRAFPGRYMPIPERVQARIQGYIAKGALLVPRSRKACDLWTGPLNGAGYPFVYWRDEDGLRRDMTGGMAVFTLERGFDDEPGNPIPESFYVCHSCDVKTCVNIEHLFIGTGHMNAKDRWRRGSSREQGVLRLEVARQIQLRNSTMYFNTVPVWLKRQAVMLGINALTGQPLPTPAPFKIITSVHMPDDGRVYLMNPAYIPNLLKGL